MGNENGSLTESLGLPFSYGVFEKFYSEHEPCAKHPEGIAAVGTTTTVSTQGRLGD